SRCYQAPSIQRGSGEQEERRRRNASACCPSAKPWGGCGGAPTIGRKGIGRLVLPMFSHDTTCNTVSFKYDPFGRRIYKSSSSGTSVFAYDGDNLIEETNSTGSAAARYSPGLNIDEPLAM